MDQRWCAGRLGVALVVAFLVFSPRLCSAWSENRDFVEQQGNSSFLCKSSGSCISCSRPDKEANKFHCRATGYHQPFKCLEIKSFQKMEQTKHDVQHLSGDRTSSREKHTIDVENGKTEVTGSHKRRLHAIEEEGRKLVNTPVFKFEGGLKTYHAFKSCTPADLRMDKFTVLQFEAITLASFALCSPLLYYRRKYSLSGMTRTPTNPHF